MLETTIESQVKRMTPVSARPEERADVEVLLKALATQQTCRLVGPGGESISLPESVFFAMRRIAEVLARGDAIAVVAVGQELTTQQAAGILNVSRQYLVRLLEDGQLPYTRTGRHRRLRIEDVLSFKERRDRERKKGLDALAAMSQDFGGYDELK